MKREKFTKHYIIRKTRWKNLGYTHLGHAWRFLHLEGDEVSTVGKYYATRTELLSDLDRFAKLFGLED